MLLEQVTPMSDEQMRSAATDPMRSFCVTAPAGSGKTSLLILRFLRLLTRVDQPEAIVAITFTRKAAAEMRVRIGEALELARTARRESLEAYQQGLYDAAMDALEQSDRCGWQLEQRLNRLRIMTIDAFCATLTLQMPVSSRLGGAIQPADDPSELYREAALELLNTRDPELQTHLTALLAVMGNRWEQTITWLSSLMAKREQWQLALFPTARADEARQFMQQTWAEIATAEATTLWQTFSPWITPLQTILAELGAIEGVDYPPLNQSHLSLKSWQRVEQFLRTKKGLWRSDVDVRQGFAPKSELKALWSEVSVAITTELSTEVFADLALMPSALEADRSWDLVVHTVAILPHLLAQFWLVCQRRQSVDFTQIAASALHALGPDEAPSDLALTLDYQIKHLLVDEFQDTSTHQYDLVRRLTRGWMEHNHSNPSAPNTLFLVGDAMQSIYRFRGAQVDLFIKAQESGFNGLIPEPAALSSNFRSCREIVEWVNMVFADTDATGHAKQSRVRASIAAPQQPSGGEVTIRGFHGAEASAAECEAVVTQVQHWLSANSTDSIAILGRSRGHLRPIILALQSSGIHVGATDISSVLDSVAAVDMCNVLRLLSDPTDIHAGLSVLRAPWCGIRLAELTHFTDWMELHEQYDLIEGLSHYLSTTECPTDFAQQATPVLGVLQHAIDNRYRRSTRVWLETLWQGLLGPMIYCAKSDQLAIDALIELIEASPDLIDSAETLEERLSSHRMSHSGDAQVEIMTMHKSKGLEFDRVILVQAARGTRTESRPLFAWGEVSSRSNYGFLIGCTKNEPEEAPGIGNWLHRRNKMLDLEESKRLLYVAATRAKRSLLITASFSTPANDETPKPAATSLLHQIWPAVVDQVRWEESVTAPIESFSQSINSPAEYRRVSREGDASVLPQRERSAPDVSGLSAELATESGLALRGTLIHKLFEFALRKSELPRLTDNKKQLLIKELLENGLSFDSALKEVEIIAETTVKTADSPLAPWLFTDPDWIREPEFPIVEEIDGEPKTRILDLVLRHISRPEVYILDFKTGQPAIGESEQAFEERMKTLYWEQLESYQRLYERFRGTRAEVCLYLTHTQSLIRFGN